MDRFCCQVYDAAELSICVNAFANAFDCKGFAVILAISVNAFANAFDCEAYRAATTITRWYQRRGDLSSRRGLLLGFSSTDATRVLLLLKRDIRRVDIIV